MGWFSKMDFRMLPKPPLQREELVQLLSKPKLVTGPSFQILSEGDLIK